MAKQAPPYSLRMPPELRERVEAEAAKQNRTMSSYIQHVLDTHTPPLKKKR